MRHPAEGIAPTPAQLVAVIAVMLAVWVAPQAPMLTERHVLASLTPVTSVSAGAECHSEQVSIRKEARGFTAVSGLMNRIVEEIGKVSLRFAPSGRDHASSRAVANEHCSFTTES